MCVHLHTVGVVCVCGVVWLCVSYVWFVVLWDQWLCEYALNQCVEVCVVCGGVVW